MNAELEQLAASLASEQDNLTALRADLSQGAPALADEIARLEAVASVCAAVDARYNTTASEAEATVTELERRGDVDPDEAVCSTAVLFNQ